MITDWYLKCYFLSEWQTQKLIARITRNYLKVMTNLGLNLKQQEALIKVTIETDRQDCPDSDTGNNARHWNITKPKFSFRNTYSASSHRN